jgi:hypothetical protein
MPLANTVHRAFRNSPNSDPHQNGILNRVSIVTWPPPLLNKTKRRVKGSRRLI